MTKIFIADTETTGLSRDDRVVEWAHIVCTLQDNQLVEVSRFETLVNPGRPIPEGASKVHGITDEMVKDAPAITEVLPKALGLLKGEHIEGYGHNFPAYDMQFIDGLLPKNADIGCSLKAARTFLGTPKNSLDFLREHIGLGDGLAHSALGDCDTTLRLINHMLKDRTWEVLSSCMLQRPTTISFGKHKGKKLEELPEDYIYWLLNKADNISWELRRALEEAKC